MINKSPLNSVLVPTDFSQASLDAFQFALRGVDGDASVIIVLHVLDEAIIDTIAAHEFAAKEEVSGRMRARAEDQMATFRNSTEAEIDIDTMVVEGLPFVEIIRKSEDFAVDAIVMGQVGAQGHVEKLLFGSTVDKVLRGTRRPVIVLPQSTKN